MQVGVKDLNPGKELRCSRIGAAGAQERGRRKGRSWVAHAFLSSPGPRQELSLKVDRLGREMPILRWGEGPGLPLPSPARLTAS